MHLLSIVIAFDWCQDWFRYHVLDVRESEEEVDDVECAWSNSDFEFGYVDLHVFVEAGIYFHVPFFCTGTKGNQKVCGVLSNNSVVLRSV